MTVLDPEQPAAAQPREQLETRRARRAAKRDARWTRPKPPRDWRYWVGGTGRVLIVTGLLMFGFVAYQLWGTGLEYARAQDQLDDDLEELFAGATTTSAAAPTTTTATTTTTTVASSTPVTAGPTTTGAPTTTVPPTAPATVPVPAFDPGQAFARLEIPRIGLETAVVSGVSAGDLKKGPGHYPDTPMPGQLGNSAVAGHRTTYGQPFFDLDDLAQGDEIIMTTVQGRFVYRVTGSEIVGAGDSQVVATTDPAAAKLTLTTCHPKYTASRRLIVYADLDVGQSGPALPPVVREDAGPPDTLAGEPTATPIPGDDPTVTSAPSSGTTATSEPTETTETTEPAVATTVPDTATTVPTDDELGEADEESADAFSHGWFSDTAAWPQVAMWGAAAALVAIGGWLLARQFRRYWVGALVAIVPFVVALFFFYQNVNRLLPAAL